MAITKEKAAEMAEKAAAKAVKSERARMSKAVANIAWPEGTTARAAAEIKRSIKAALAEA
jgi:pyrroline-5-carboxylate reductase